MEPNYESMRTEVAEVASPLIERDAEVIEFPSPLTSRPAKRRDAPSSLEIKLIQSYTEATSVPKEFLYAAKILGGHKKTVSKDKSAELHSFENRIEYLGNYISQVQDRLESDVEKGRLTQEDAVRSVERLEEMLGRFEDYARKSRGYNTSIRNEKLERRIEKYKSAHGTSANLQTYEARARSRYADQKSSFDNLINKTRVKLSNMQTLIYTVTPQPAEAKSSIVSPIDTPPQIPTEPPIITEPDVAPTPAAEPVKYAPDGYVHMVANRQMKHLPNMLKKLITKRPLPRFECTYDANLPSLLESMNTASLPSLLYTRFMPHEDGRHYMPINFRGEDVAIDLLAPGAHIYAGQEIKARARNFFRYLVSSASQMHNSVKAMF